MANRGETPSPRRPRAEDRSLPAVTTLLRLRWWLIASELIAIVFTARVVEQAVHIGPFVAIVMLQLVTNLAASYARRARPGSRTGSYLLKTLLGLDIVCLTLIIHFSGGPTNPFSSLFVILTLVAAIVLPARSSMVFAVMSCLCYGVVLYLETGGDLRHEAFQRIGASMHHAIGGHLVGMWLSLVLTIAAVTIFGGQLMRKLRENEESLARSRSEIMEAARVASLTSFAAGAAHELSTPLSTIAVAVGELSRRAGAPEDIEWRRDLSLIKSEIGRCQRIIQSLRFDVNRAHLLPGKPFGQQLREELSVLLGEAALARVRFADGMDTLLDSMPVRGIAHAVAALVRNAIEASPPGRTVELALHDTPGALVIRVTDYGDGIPPNLLPTVMEPFVTTKPVGQGLGLGLFLARVICDQLNATLGLDSHAGRGTVATITVPRYEGRA
jgi:two-component system sensor histidine kinase RegB